MGMELWKQNGKKYHENLKKNNRYRISTTTKYVDNPNDHINSFDKLNVISFHREFKQK
jgi:hypothetical protein